MLIFGRGNELGRHTHRSSDPKSHGNPDERQKTSFVIAHRLSTIRNADLILGDGKTAISSEQGNHNELLAKKGLL